jgi:hypothetical protein
VRCSIKVDWLPGSRAREEASEQYVQRVSEIEGKNQNADDVAKQNADALPPHLGLKTKPFSIPISSVGSACPACHGQCHDSNP